MNVIFPNLRNTEIEDLIIKQTMILESDFSSHDDVPRALFIFHAFSVMDHLSIVKQYFIKNVLDFELSDHVI